jgi:diadenosine tetraphosphate (Ap4A) HIT family hydrolase
MLIRWATIEDLSVWKELSKEYDLHIAEIATNFSKWYEGFDEFMLCKIEQYDAVLAMDRMTDSCNGAIAFSRINNRITFFAISPKANHVMTAEKLLKVALRQLNSNQEISINLPNGKTGCLADDRRFFEKNGFRFVKDENIDGCPMSHFVRDADCEKRYKSFHYRYPEWIKEALDIEYCPPCRNDPMPDNQIDIILTDKICVGGEYPGQGRLFGKLYVMPIAHYFHFEDMPNDEAEYFMNYVRRVGRALRKVTGAVKINYEMHSNSGAHLHIHLFPRYLDDDFPGQAIDVNLREPAPYESYEEYLWFVERMRMELSKN